MSRTLLFYIFFVYANEGKSLSLVPRNLLALFQSNTHHINGRYELKWSGDCKMVHAHILLIGLHWAKPTVVWEIERCFKLHTQRRRGFKSGCHQSSYKMKHDRSRQNDDAREITEVTPTDRFKVPTTSPLPFNDFISVLELSALNFYFRYL